LVTLQGFSAFAQNTILVVRNRILIELKRGKTE